MAKSSKNEGKKNSEGILKIAVKLQRKFHPEFYPTFCPFRVFPSLASKADATGSPTKKIKQTITNNRANGFKKYIKKQIHENKRQAALSLLKANGQKATQKKNHHPGKIKKIH